MRRLFSELRRAWSHWSVKVIMALVGVAFWYTGASGRSLLWHTGPHLVSKVPGGDAIGRLVLIALGVLIVALAWGPTAWRNARSLFSTDQPGAQIGDESADRRAEITSRDRLVPTLRYTLDSPPALILSVENTGPTIRDAKLNLFAARRPERQWVFRLTGAGGPASSGSTSEIDHETTPGYAKSLRWDEAELTLHGYSTTELRFFFPRFAEDPVHLRIGSDDLLGWLEWVFVTPGDDKLMLTLQEDAERRGTVDSADTPDPAQLRRALDRASAKLRKQRDLIWEWRLHVHLDPDDRGEWETEDRKGILHQDPRFRSAFHATEDAFNAISLMKDPTSYHRDQALAKIDLALKALDAASELVSD